VSTADLQSLAPGLVPFADGVYVEAARIPGRPGEARYGPLGSWVFAWLDLAALPAGLAARLAAGAEDGWLCIGAEDARSQVRNRVAALKALEARVVAAAERPR
jgi:hypothetical protein